MADLVPCETCQGRGEVRALCVRTATGSGPGEIQCPACRWSGKVDARQDAWIEAGEAMRADRLARDLSLREEAIRRGVSAAVLSDMELGRIEPKPEAPRG